MAVPTPLRGRPRAPRAPHLPADSLALALYHAAGLVAAVLDGHALTQPLARLSQTAPTLSPAQRGAIQDLTYSTLRAGGHGESLLAPLLRSMPPAPVYALLLVAACRLEQRPEQAHTLVDQAVNACGEMLGGKLRGMVNGVLRNLVRRHRELEAGIRSDDEAVHRHPAWWLARLRARYPDQWPSVVDADNHPPPMALRVNRRHLSPQEMLDRLAAADIAARPHPTGALLLAQPVPVSRIPGFAAGDCSVQDPGAQRAAQWMDLQDGQRVLDACSAPGGKSAHMLELANIRLTALELDASRAERVRETFHRLNLDARLSVADCRDLAQWWDGTPFDRILADVPCSASGVVRRHPDIKWLRREEDIVAFAMQQAEILDRLWQTLRPGGKMLYATCSVFEEENSAQVRAFCASHGDASVISLDGLLEQQLLPCADHDGFFYALLEKAG